MEGKTMLILEKDGVYKGGPFKLVGNINDLLAEAAAGIPTDIPSLYSSPHQTKVHMRATRNRITLYCSLRRLVLNTVWRPYGDGGKLHFPVGVKQNESDYGATLNWEPFGIERYPQKEGEAITLKEGDMLLWYVFTSIKNGRNWVAGECYLVATRVGDKKFYRLPLANIYDDGRICMGNGYALEGATLQARFDNSLKFFEASPWNTDLIDYAQAKPEHRQAMFSFDGKGRQKGPDAEWPKQCAAISNGNYSELPGMIVQLPPAK